MWVTWGVATQITDRSIDQLNHQRHTPSTLSPGNETTIPTWQDVGWASGAVWVQWWKGSFTLPGVSSGPPEHNRSLYHKCGGLIPTNFKWGTWNQTLFIHDCAVHRKKIMIFSLSRSIIKTFKTLIGKACCEFRTILGGYNLGVSELVSWPFALPVGLFVCGCYLDIIN
jgi:hypothetical protein